MVICLLGCSTRPDEEAVKKLFNEEHPKIKILEVRIIEDEVVARSFIIKYRIDSLQAKYEQMWSYFDDGESYWRKYEPKLIK